MSTTSPCDHRGVPTTLLGMSYRSWTGTQIQIILDHYQWQYDQITRSKQNLMHELDLLIQEHDLDIQDRRDILNALKRGDPLPRRKSRVRRVPHSALPDRKAIARRERAQNRAQTRAFTDPSHKSASALPRDCTVCFETLNPQTIPERRITSSCSHEPDVCRSCLATSIATQLDSKVWDHIDCPTCGQRLGFQDVKEFADHEVFERYDNYSLQSCLSSGQFQRCRHPHCQSGQQCFPEQDSYMICVACRGRTCITCDIIWHPSETCANVAARRAEARGAEEAAAMEYLTTRVKLCPRCNVRGEKVDGCDHMECPQCHYEYCWVCLADYTEIRRRGNIGHRNKCTYHSDNLPGLPRHIAVPPTQSVAPQPAAPQPVAPRRMSARPTQPRFRSRFMRFPRLYAGPDHTAH